ncbi:trypsin, alkaline B-like [Trichoplusia ni]|uniref:Trypsin, alkaline B-like n=1 Tax=Trichoplusia ni TaxID=7111 RepID=A0A7E5VXT5_TRINI|nr:trypsin, alkaline B-like [Trichoplusia ni]
MRVLALLALCVAVVAAVPSSTRLAGGNFVNISRYPSLASLTVTWNGVNHNFQCAAVLINNRSAVTAAHCVYYSPPNQFRLRVGSSYVNSGGVMHNVNSLRYHPNYSDSSYRYDVGLVRTSSNINQNNNVRPAPIAGSNYNLGNNQNVWATGWRHSSGSNNNRQIADSQMQTVSQSNCNSRYSGVQSISSDMVCTGWANQNSNGQCNGVFGAGIFHSGTLVGVTAQCMSSRPTINTRVSSFSSWIQSNA